MDVHLFRCIFIVSRKNSLTNFKHQNKVAIKISIQGHNHLRDGIDMQIVDCLKTFPMHAQQLAPQFLRKKNEKTYIGGISGDKVHAGGGRHKKKCWQK